MLKEERAVVLHQGIYKPTATVSEAVFMITGMTIGAGILGLPYAVAQVGLIPGLISILVLGIIVLTLNLMIGEIAVRTGQNMQIPGFAGKYLGSWARKLLSVTIVISAYGTLLAYLVGEGNALAAIFGGNPVAWSVIFWSVGSFLIWGGLQRIKRIEKILSLAVISIIVALSLYLLPDFDTNVIKNVDASKFFLPLGVILFALHASPAIAEAHALLPGSQRHFRKAVIIGTIIPVLVYVLFTLAVVGFGGKETTEIATIGLGYRLGPVVTIIANIFAVFAMSTGFIGLGTALKQMFVWDHHFPENGSKFLVIALPLSLFLLGLRSFIGILDIVGGLFIGFESVMIIAIYFQARRRGDIDPVRFKTWQHPKAVVLPILLFFSIVMFISVYKIFAK